MRPSKPPAPKNRDGVWYLRKHVPKKYAHLEKRSEVWLTTGISVVQDPRGLHAKSAVAELDAALEESWRLTAEGRADDAKTRFEAAQKRARILQVPYLTNEELAEGPLEEILKRIDMLVSRNNADDELDVSAVWGLENRPVIRLSTLLEHYEDIHKVGLAKKTENQMRKWRNQRKRAIKYFIELIGDKEITKVSRADALQYRIWWRNYVFEKDLQLASANKSIGFIVKMVKDVNREFDLGIGPQFADLRFAGARDRKRPAYTAEFVQRRILAPRALETMNPQARAILLVVAELGLRPSEVANLRARKIFLDAEIPFIRVLGDERELKTHDSERDMPLVGNALEAMREFPDGFPAYRDNEDTLSNTVNKYLEEHGLRPTIKHTFYSLRHTFEDRLTAVEPPEKIMAVLMGHAYDRPKYGEGPTLEQKHRWLKKVAFKTPTEIAGQD